MPLASPDRRTMLRYALCSTFVILAPVSSAIGSEMTAPIEQLHAGLIVIMKAGKVAPSAIRQDCAGNRPGFRSRSDCQAGRWVALDRVTIRPTGCAAGRFSPLYHRVLRFQL